MSKSYRVLLRDDHGDEVRVNGWATITDTGERLVPVEMDHLYPDWQPVPGCVLDCRLGQFRVASVDGKKLLMQKVEV